MATASQLVLRARAESELALLDAAETVAREGTDWCAIAETFPREQRARAAHCLSRALAVAGTDLVTYRNVARIHEQRFGDPSAASHALANAAAMLLASEASTADWCALADAWRWLGDRDAADDYLRHAAAAARTAADFCALGDITRAESLARGVHDRIAIAKLCDDAQDLDRSTAALHAAIAEITSVDDATAVASALERFGASAEDRARCFAAGEQYAVTAGDLIALSRIAPDVGVRRRLFESAYPIADERDRARMADLGRRGNDPQPPPPRWTPDELMPWSARSLGWPHEPARLFDQLRRTVSPATLRSIAACDYGYEIEQNLAAIMDIVDTGHVLHPLPWFPLEVLQLERWAEGPDVDHVGHLFACTALLLDDVGPVRYIDGNESTVTTHLQSAITLGRDTLDAAIGFYAALANAARDPLARAFFELVLILAAVWRDARDPRIAPAIDRLIHDEARLRTENTVWDTTWLLGLTNFDQRHAMLRRLARAILAPSVPHDPKLAQLAQLLTR